MFSWPPSPNFLDLILGKTTLYGPPYALFGGNNYTNLLMDCLGRQLYTDFLMHCMRDITLYRPPHALYGETALYIPPHGLYGGDSSIQTS